MKKKHEHIIESVRPGSIAEELGIEPGDVLLEIDGQVIEDIFDYQFYVESEELLVVIRKANGEEWELEIEKDVGAEEMRLEKDPESMSQKELEKLIADLTKQMKKAAAELNFEAAAELRDKLVELKKMLNDME